LTLKEEMLEEMKAEIERLRHQCAALWWIIGLLAVAVIVLVS
jgi:hypothetical protein